MDTINWTGTHVSGSTACAVVRYSGPTDTRGSRWLATITRDSETKWRASVSFADGPLVAAEAAAAKGGTDWVAARCHTIDSDTYVVGFRHS